MLEEALGIFRATGNRPGEADALNEVGALNRTRGNLDQALAYYRQALALAREISSPRDEGRALVGLGRCAMADGRLADAETALRQAQEIFQRTGAAEAAEVAAELEDLAGPSAS
jgi:tetratricopeptide (TPR) repeat protein